MNEFGWNSGEPITNHIAEKTVAKCEVCDEGIDSILQFTFADGTVLRFRYDWIYEWEIKQAISHLHPKP